MNGVTRMDSNLADPQPRHVQSVKSPQNKGKVPMRTNATTKDTRHSAPTRRIRFGFVLTPRFTLTAFAGFVDALRLAADEGDLSRPIDCEWVVLGDCNAPITSSCGAAITPWGPMVNPEQFDYIVVVGGLLHGGQKVLPDTHAFLHAASCRSVALVGLCTGVFVMARAGLLKGYVACVSWYHREDFEREFPGLHQTSNQLFMVDRDRLTCAGGTSVVQLAAFLIERHFGRAQAIKSLRILIEDQPLPSRTLQPESVMSRHGKDTIVHRAMLMIERKLSEPDPLMGIATSLGVSLRQLERRFVSDVGVTPRDYRLHLRLERAKWMVDHTDLSVTDIGLECGFSDCSHFSRVFSSRFKTSPSRWRRANATPATA